MRFGGPGKCTGAFGFGVRVEGRKDCVRFSRFLHYVIPPDLMRTPARRLCAVQEGSVRFGGPGKCTGAFGFRVRVEGRKDCVGFPRFLHYVIPPEPY